MDFNFNYIGHCDVSELKTKISEINYEVWGENQYRQDTFDAHKYTETIDLVWDANSLFNNTVGEIKKNYYDFEIEKLLHIIKPLYENFYGFGDFIRIIFTKLKSNSEIKPHVDNGHSLSICKRTHIPIVTNELVYFKVDNETINMKEGEIWEINNQKIHSVVNKSNIDRVHLIIDYLRQEKNYKKLF